MTSGFDPGGQRGVVGSERWRFGAGAPAEPPQASIRNILQTLNGRVFNSRLIAPAPNDWALNLRSSTAWVLTGSGVRSLILDLSLSGWQTSYPVDSIAVNTGGMRGPALA